MDSDWIICQCPQCSRKYKVGTDHLGKKIRCKHCDAAFELRPQIPPIPPSPPQAAFNDIDVNVSKLADQAPKSHQPPKPSLKECPKCGEECEVYTRVVGFIRPVKQWNEGKTAEYHQRVTFKIADDTKSCIQEKLLSNR